MLSALRQPRRARLLRRAAQSSGPSGVPAVRGMRPPQPGRIPRQGPVYRRRQPAGDSASPAALPLPPGTRESPPHHPRRRHAQRDAPAKRGGKRGAHHENGSAGRWEIPRVGDSPSKISGSLRTSFGRGLWRGKSRASSVPRGGKQPKAVSSSNALFQADDGKRFPALPPPSTGPMPTSLLLPGTLPTWKELSRVNPCRSYHGSLPLLCPAPGFCSDIHRDASSCCWVSFPLLQPAVLHKAGIQQPEFTFYSSCVPVRSSWPSCRSDKGLLIASICSEWRIQPILGHTWTSWDWGASIPC